MDNNAKNINIRVCILNWNGGETLHRCIDSLSQNTIQDFSITIIDNGSTDGSLDNVKSNIEPILNNLKSPFKKRCLKLRFKT